MAVTISTRKNRLRGNDCDNCPLRFECFSSDEIRLIPEQVHRWRNSKRYFMDNISYLYVLPKCLTYGSLCSMLFRSSPDELGMWYHPVLERVDSRRIRVFGYEPDIWRQQDDIS